ncbi:MAG: putative transcriptional regulator [Psychromonas sp.]|jgi:predicted transcriptional regulator
MSEVNFAKELRIYIAANHGSNQGKYAKHLGVSASFISSVTCGRANPTKRILEDLGLEIEIQVNRKVIYTRVLSNNTDKIEG